VSLGQGPPAVFHLAIAVRDATLDRVRRCHRIALGKRGRDGVAVGKQAVAVADALA